MHCDALKDVYLSAPFEDMNAQCHSLAACGEEGRGRTSHRSRVLSGREQEHVPLLGLHASHESRPPLFYDELGDRGIPVPTGFWEYR